MNKLTVYSKGNCPECSKACAFLDSKDIEYEVVKVDESPADYDFLIQKGHKSVPQIYQDGHLFVEGGYKGLLKMFAAQ